MIPKVFLQSFEVFKQSTISVLSNVIDLESFLKVSINFFLSRQTSNNLKMRSLINRFLKQHLQSSWFSLLRSSN